MINIVGVDISLNNIGICKATVKDNLVIVNEVMLISPPKTDAATKKQVRKNCDDLRRAIWLQNNLIEAIEHADIVSVEMPFGSQSARAMASYGIAIGVLASVKKPMIQVSPAEVKLAGFGVKTATKQEMILWATTKHPGANWKTKKRNGKQELTACNEHAADATAAIYAALKTEQFKSAMAMAKAFSKTQ